MRERGRDAHTSGAHKELGPCGTSKAFPYPHGGWPGVRPDRPPSLPLPKRVAAQKIRVSTFLNGWDAPEVAQLLTFCTNFSCASLALIHVFKRFIYLRTR